MDNKEIDNNLLEETDDAGTSDTNDEQTDSTVKSKSGSGLALVAILLSLGALAACGYLFLTQNNQVRQMLSSVNGLEGSLQTMRTDMGNNQQRLQKNLERQNAEIQTLKKSTAQLYSNVENTQQTWSVEEVHQLLQLAVDQLTLAANIDGALAALNIADRRIADNGDPELQAVRQQIAKDIASLHQVERLDLAGTIHRLRAVEESIDHLPVGRQTSMTSKVTTKEDSTDKSDSVWQQIGQDLSGLVKIRSIDQPEVPLLPPGQQYFLRENTSALVMTARMALLRNDSESYRNSLQQVHQWLVKYFDTGSQNTKWAINEVEMLAAINPTPQLPDIKGSLTQLQAITEGKQN